MKSRSPPATTLLHESISPLRLIPFTASASVLSPQPPSPSAINLEFIPSDNETPANALIFSPSTRQDHDAPSTWIQPHQPSASYKSMI
ncbi:hypothetical protein BGS_0978 [Beggiatoa sp. SS]|nr:hypothetical protein BGS_0978 [Beggiatoa sp. SS]